MVFDDNSYIRINEKMIISLDYINKIVFILIKNVHKCCIT